MGFRQRQRDPEWLFKDQKLQKISLKESNKQPEWEY